MVELVATAVDARARRLVAVKQNLINIYSLEYSASQGFGMLDQPLLKPEL
jgi:hypothetical protein